jgi:hypothetical protein
MPYAPQTWIDGSGLAISAAHLNYVEAGIGTAQTTAETALAVAQAAQGGSGATGAKLGRLFIDDYTATGDDNKLTPALAAAAAATYPPVITFGNRQHTFNTVDRAFFDGLRIEGPPGSANPEHATQTKMPCRVHLSMTGSWFTMIGSTSYYSVYFGSLPLTGGSQATFLGQGAGTGSLRNLLLRDISAVNLKTVLGTQATKLLLTSPTFDGAWDINATYNGAVHIGGSGEGILWPAGGLFDGGGSAYTAAGSSVGQATIWLDGFEFASIGPIFVTCEDDWEGLRISGAAYNTSTGNQGGPVRISGATIEGRNAGAPCYGAVCRVLGGIAMFRGCSFLHGLSSAAAMGHSPTDAGVVDVQTGAVAYFDGCSFDRYTGQAETVPMVYVRSGAAVRMENTYVTAKGGVWTGLPRISNQAGAGGTITTSDGTYTVI